MTYRDMIFAMHRAIQAAGGQTPIPLPSLDLSILYLNQALQYSGEITDYLLKREDITNVNASVVDTQFNDIFQVWWNNNRLYRHLEITTQTGNLASGVPQYYIARSGRIALFPAPSSAGTLTVMGIAKHPTVTNSDVVLSQKSEFPEWVAQAIVLLATGYYLLLFPEHIQRANAYLERAENTLVILRQRVMAQRMQEIAPSNTIAGWVYQIAHPHLQNISFDAINAMVNQAYTHYFGFVNALLTHLTVSVPANTQILELNNHSVVEVYRVFLEDGDGYIPLPAWDGNWELITDRYKTGKPQQYVAYGNRIELFPTADNNYTIRIEGAIIPSSNPLSYIPAHLHFSIAEYAAGLLLMSVYTEKGNSVGMMYRQSAMQQWLEWRRQQVSNSYQMNEESGRIAEWSYPFPTTDY